MTGVWLVAVAVSGAQYGGVELMKFRGDDVSTLGVWPEVIEGWEVIGGVEWARTGFVPLADTAEASGTGFRGKLVS